MKSLSETPVLGLTNSAFSTGSAEKPPPKSVSPAPASRGHSSVNCHGVGSGSAKTSSSATQHHRQRQSRRACTTPTLVSRSASSIQPAANVLASTST